MDLIRAAETGDIEVVRLLLDHGANPNIKNKYGNTALFWASINDHIEIVRLLLDHGADPNIKGKYGNTALFWASYYGHIEVVRLLLDHGADPNIKNEYGETAYMVSKNEDIRQMLRSYGRSMHHTSDRSRSYMIEYNDISFSFQ